VDVAVSGSSGLIGGALCDRLEERGDTVRRLVRRPADSPREIRWDPDRGLLDPGRLEGVNAVAHLAGAGIANRHWTRSRMDLILGSRTRGTHLISSAMAESRRAGTGPGILVSGSAIGFYGDRPDEPLDETSARGGGSWPMYVSHGRPPPERLNQQVSGSHTPVPESSCRPGEACWPHSCRCSGWAWAALWAPERSG
jgi:nucleoside-diphosphate-sugar epimerase